MAVVASSIVASVLRQCVGDDHPRSINTKMELLPAARTTDAMFRPGPLAFAHDRQSRAVNDQMHTFPGRDSIKREVKILAAPGERRVIWGGEVDAHHPEERMQEPLRLPEWQVEEKTERQCRFDGHVGALPLPAPNAGARGFPGGDG